MPFGKHLLSQVLFTSAVEEEIEQSCVIFRFYFMSLLAVNACGDMTISSMTLFMESYFLHAQFYMKETDVITNQAMPFDVTGDPLCGFVSVSLLSYLLIVRYGKFGNELIIKDLRNA